MIKRMSRLLYSYRQLILRFLQSYLTQRVSDMNLDNRWVEDVVSRLSKLNSGGKMIRGALLILSHDIFGGTSKNDAIKVAAALELFQGSILIHDDIIDRDMTRRGLPTIHFQYQEYAKKQGFEKPDLFGTGMGMVTADIGFFWAYQLLSTLKAENPIKENIISLISREMATVGFGEMEDIYLSSNSQIPTLKEILNCYRYKTARYSFSLPLTLGGLLAFRNPEILKSLSELGELMGLIFQIKDDELGLFGNEKQTGKPVGSDIIEGKKTHYYFYLARILPKNEWLKLKLYFGIKPLSAEQVSEIRNTIYRYSIQKKIDALTGEYTSKTVSLIKQLPISGKYRRELFELLNFLLQRKK